MGKSQFYEKFRLFLVHISSWERRIQSSNNLSVLKCHGVDACKDTHSHNCHICDNAIRNVNHSFPSGLWESSSGGLWHSSTLSAFDKPHLTVLRLTWRLVLLTGFLQECDLHLITKHIHFRLGSLGIAYTIHYNYLHKKDAQCVK